MKNKILLFAMILLVSIPIYSFAQYKIDMEITGFWGVPFKSTKEQVKKLMAEKKDCVFGAFDSETNTFVYMGGSFNGYKVDCAGLTFYNDSFYYGLVLLKSTSETFVITNYKTLKRDLTTKYTLPTIDIENYKFPFKKGDSEQVEAIRLEKADFQTHWHFTHAKIILKIDKNLTISVAYFDDMIKDIVDSIEKKDNSKDL